MNIIFFSKREGLARQLNLAHPVTFGIVTVLVLGILGTAFMLGMQLGQGSGGRLAHGESARWTQVLAEQKHQIAELKERMNERVDAMAMRMGEVNAHVIRLDALGNGSRKWPISTVTNLISTARPRAVDPSPTEPASRPRSPTSP